MLTIGRVEVGITGLEPKRTYRGGLGIRLPKGKSMGIFVRWPEVKNPQWLVISESDIFVGHDVADYTNVWTEASSERLAQAIVEKLRSEDPKGRFTYIEKESGR